MRTETLVQRTGHYPRTEAAIARAAFFARATITPPARTQRKESSRHRRRPCRIERCRTAERQRLQSYLFDSKPMPGGLLRYGIPNFKLDKAVIDRRMKILEAEESCSRWESMSMYRNCRRFDAYAILYRYAHRPRPLHSGQGAERHLLCPRHAGNSRTIFWMEIPSERPTRQRPRQTGTRHRRRRYGSDCIGTSIRQGAVSVTQIEIMPQPPIGQPGYSWPQWPVVLKPPAATKKAVPVDGPSPYPVHREEWQRYAVEVEEVGVASGNRR